MIAKDVFAELLFTHSNGWGVRVHRVGETPADDAKPGDGGHRFAWYYYSAELIVEEWLAAAIERFRSRNWAGTPQVFSSWVPAPLMFSGRVISGEAEYCHSAVDPETLRIGETLIKARWQPQSQDIVPALEEAAVRALPPAPGVQPEYVLNKVTEDGLWVYICDKFTLDIGAMPHAYVMAHKSFAAAVHSVKTHYAPDTKDVWSFKTADHERRLEYIFTDLELTNSLWDDFRVQLVRNVYYETLKSLVPTVVRPPPMVKIGLAAVTPATAPPPASAAAPMRRLPPSVDLSVDLETVRKPAAPTQLVLFADEDAEVGEKRRREPAEDEDEDEDEDEEERIKPHLSDAITKAEQLMDEAFASYPPPGIKKKRVCKSCPSCKPVAQSLRHVTEKEARARLMNNRTF